MNMVSCTSKFAKRVDLIVSVLTTKTNKQKKQNKGTQETSGSAGFVLLLWWWWWCHRCLYISKFITFYVVHRVFSRVWLLWPHGLSSTRLLGPWDSPDKNTGLGCQLLPQGILPTQGLNPSPALQADFFTFVYQLYRSKAIKKKNWIPWFLKHIKNIVLTR